MRTDATPAHRQATVRERLAAAAFTQFSARGFDATTIDQITKAAGVSRRTFFRHFDTKEDVVFPEHDRLRAEVAADLTRRRDEAPLAAVSASVALVLADYVGHRDASLLRFALTRSVTALRDREITSVHRYQRLFARHLREHLTDTDPLTPELMAAAVVAAHNSVLRAWLLSGATTDPTSDLVTALDHVQDLFSESRDSETVIAVFSSSTSARTVADAIRRHTETTP